MPDRGLDDVAVAEVAGDGLRLGGRLDDDETTFGHGCPFRVGRRDPPRRSAGCAGHHSGAVAHRKCPAPAILERLMPVNPRPSWSYLLIGALSYPVLRAPSITSSGEAWNSFLPTAGTSSPPTTGRTSDPWPLGMPLFPRRYLRFMAKSELFWFPLGPFIAACGAFPSRAASGSRAPRRRRPPLSRRPRRRPPGHAAPGGRETRRTPR